MRNVFLSLCCLLFAVGLAIGQESVPIAEGPPLSAPVPAAESLAWGRVDYLLWWTKPVCLNVAAITTGDPRAAVPGAFGQPGTGVVQGQRKFEFLGASGVRPVVGTWFGPSRWLGVEASGFVLEQKANVQALHVGSANPPTYLPFTSQTLSAQALPFSIPGVVDGAAVAIGRSQLWGAEVNALTSLGTPTNGWGLETSWLAGFRYLDLADSITITNVQSLVTNPAVRAVGEDVFRTHNQFYGVQLGHRLGWNSGRFSASATGKVAFGETRLRTTIVGTPLAGPPVAPGLVPGPLFALRSNIGEVETQRVTIVPEAEVRVGYRVTDAVRVTAGFNFLYWNRIFCPGDFMTQSANITQLPGRGPEMGAKLPPPVFVKTDYFATGLDLGLEYRY